MQQTIRHSVASPLGALTLYWNDQGICRLSYSGESPESYRPWWDRWFGPVRLDEAAAPAPWADELRAYFRGEPRALDLPLDLRGTPFQLEVWNLLRRIPYGQTWSYRDLAQHSSRPRGYRAVGAANGRNPVPILVPCHRVVAADGGLGGYSSGLAIKRRLLDLESIGAGRFQARLLPEPAASG